MKNQEKKRQQFQLFQTPLDLAHAYWAQLLKPGNFVIDATCGNGHDTLFLAQAVLCENGSGRVIAMDSQLKAIENTQKLLETTLPDFFLNAISLHHQCHSSFPTHLKNESVHLIVYNLGYLPGGDKTLTTLSNTTIQSLEAALPLIVPGGAMSITCYPGHAAGLIEEERVLNFAATLDPKYWSCCHHRWANRKNAPSLLIIQRST